MQKGRDSSGFAEGRKFWCFFRRVGSGADCKNDEICGFVQKMRDSKFFLLRGMQSSGLPREEGSFGDFQRGAVLVIPETGGDLGNFCTELGIL